MKKWTVLMFTIYISKKQIFTAVRLLSGELIGTCKIYTAPTLKTPPNKKKATASLQKRRIEMAVGSTVVRSSLLCTSQVSK